MEKNSQKFPKVIGDKLVICDGPFAPTSKPIGNPLINMI